MSGSIGSLRPLQPRGQMHAVPFNFLSRLAVRPWLRVPSRTGYSRWIFKAVYLRSRSATSR